MLKVSHTKAFQLLPTFAIIANFTRFAIKKPPGEGGFCSNGS